MLYLVIFCLGVALQVGRNPFVDKNVVLIFATDWR